MSGIMGLLGKPIAINHGCCWRVLSTTKETTVMINATLNVACPLVEGRKSQSPRIANTQRCQRQAKLFVRSQFGARGSKGITVSRASTVEDLRGAYGLVHDAYVEKGYCGHQPGGMRLRVFEALLETATFVAKDGERVVAVMSLVPDSSDLGLPSESVYTKEIEALRRAGRWVGEVTNLAVDPSYRQTDLFFQLAQIMQAHAMRIGIDDLFASISPGHANFFELFLCFEPWGERRDYGAIQSDWVEGKRLNLHTAERMALQHDQSFGDYAFLHDWFFVENPFLDRSDAVGNAGGLRRAEALRKLIGFADLLQRFSQEQCAAVRKRLNGEILRGFKGVGAAA